MRKHPASAWQAHFLSSCPLEISACDGAVRPTEPPVVFHRRLDLLLFDTLPAPDEVSSRAWTAAVEQITANAPGRTPPMVEHSWVVGVADWYSYAWTWQAVEPSASPNPQRIEFYNDGNEPFIRYQVPGGALLEFRRRGSARALRVTSAVSPEERWIRWNTVTGQGSVLLWPSGETLCWDRNQLDTMECFAP